MAETTPNTARVNPYAGMTVAQIAAARREKAAAAPGNRDARMAQLKTQREANMMQRALARAASDPKYNFTQRPAGFIDAGNQVIRYYGWNGGKTTGQWVGREAPLTKRNYDMYKNQIPAAEFAFRDVKSRGNIVGGPKADGFTVRDGKVVAVGKVDESILTMQSDLNMEKILSLAGPRETKMLNEALARAQKSPMFNFMQRPAGRITEDKIVFYSWIGGKVDGEWRAYEAVNNAENFNKYATLIRPQEYFQPTSIRDVLTPVTNIYGKSWGEVGANKKVVPEFKQEDISNVYNDAQITEINLGQD